MTRGFTLIEVLVALAILATALTAGSSSVRSSARSASHLQESMLLEWTAENALNRLRLLKPEAPSIEPYAVNQYGLTLLVSPTREVVSETHQVKLIVNVARKDAPAEVLLHKEITVPL